MIDRVERLHATLLVYVIGTPQSQHLQMVFKAAEMLGVLVPPARAVHVNFGNVLGDDRKMLKSRSGEPAMLLDLVDEAIERGRAVGRRAQPGAAGRRAAPSWAACIGIGALEVRRALQRPHQGLRLRLGSHARVRRQHGALPAVRPRPHLQHLPPCRRRARLGALGRARAGRAAGAGAGAAAAAVRRRRARHARQVQPAPAVHLPVRPGAGVHRRSTRPARC